MFQRKNTALLAACLAPLSACTVVDIAVWSDEGGLVEVSGDAVQDTCDIWQTSGTMQTDCPQDASGIASWSGSEAANVYTLKAIPDPGYDFTGWTGCDLSGTDGFITWRFYTTENGTVCNVDHGGQYGSYTLRLAASEDLADVSANFAPTPQ